MRHYSSPWLSLLRCSTEGRWRKRGTARISPILPRRDSPSSETPRCMARGVPRGLSSVRLLAPGTQTKRGTSRCRPVPRSRSSPTEGISGLRRERNGSRSGERLPESRDHEAVSVNPHAIKATRSERRQGVLVLEPAEFALHGGAAARGDGLVGKSLASSGGN